MTDSISDFKESCREVSGKMVKFLASIPGFDCSEIFLNRSDDSENCIYHYDDEENLDD